MPGDTDISDEAVRKATGRGWGDWFAALDDLGAGDAAMRHRERAARLTAAHPDLSGWWCQMVTVQYERERGFRAVHEAPGGYQFSVQKTLPLDAQGAWAALMAADWLPGADWSAGATFETDAGVGVTVRIVEPGKQLRFWWHEPEQRSTVVVQLWPSGPKTAVRFLHEGLGAPEDVERMKGAWREALGRVASAAGA